MENASIDILCMLCCRLLENLQQALTLQNDTQSKDL